MRALSILLPRIRSGIGQASRRGVGKVNTEEEPELAGMFAIRSIPTLMILREKVILYSEAGALPANALEDIVIKAQALDMAKVHEEIAKERSSESDPDA